MLFPSLVAHYVNLFFHLLDSKVFELRGTGIAFEAVSILV